MRISLPLAALIVFAPLRAWADEPTFATPPPPKQPPLSAAAPGKPQTGPTDPDGGAWFPVPGASSPSSTVTPKVPDPPPLPDPTSPRKPPRPPEILPPLDKPLAVEVVQKGYKFYGWQLLITEGAGVTLFDVGILSAMNGEAKLGAACIVLGSLTDTLGGFVGHTSHDRWTKAGASLAFTIGAPVTGALLGLAYGDATCITSGCKNRMALWGTVFGAAASPLLDGFILGWAKKQNTYKPPKTPACSAICRRSRCRFKAAS